MSFRTKHLGLTEDQKKRGVIYSSVLIVTNKDIDSVLHEVYADDPRAAETIANLEDVSFFKHFAKIAGYDVINEVRT